MELSKLNIKGLSLLLQKVKIQFRSNLVFFNKFTYQNNNESESGVSSDDGAFGPQWQ